MSQPRDGKIEYNKNRFDKSGLLIIGLVTGFSIGVAVSTWDWFPEGRWGNPIAVIPQTLLSYFSLLAPFAVVFIYLLVRRKVFKLNI